MLKDREYSYAPDVLVFGMLWTRFYVCSHSDEAMMMATTTMVTIMVYGSLS